MTRFVRSLVTLHVTLWAAAAGATVLDVGTYVQRLDDNPGAMSGIIHAEAVFGGSLAPEGFLTASGSYAVTDLGPPVQVSWTAKVAPLIGSGLQVQMAGEMICALGGCNSSTEHGSFVGSVLSVFQDPLDSLPDDAVYTLDGSGVAITHFAGVALTCATGGLVRCREGTVAINYFPKLPTPAGVSTQDFESEYYNAAMAKVAMFSSSVTFEGGVTTPGSTAVSGQSDGPGVPADFVTALGPLRGTWFDVQTDALYDPPVVFCASYPQALPEGSWECQVELLHQEPLPLASCSDWEDGWCNRTIQDPDPCPLSGDLCVGPCIDKAANRICARADSFSFFVPALDLRPACSNGADDDGDTLVDYPADPHCASASDLTEAAPGPYIYVDVTADELDADGDCSLREAIRAANLDVAVSGCAAGSGPDTIIVPAGTFPLTIAGAAEDDAATGDLDLRSDVVLVGAGAGLTVIDAAGLGDRVMHVQPPAAGPDIQVEVHDLTLRGGSVDLFDGGAGIGIQESAGGSPTTKLEGCVIEENEAGVGAGVAMLHASGGTTTISKSVVRSNQAYGGAGGIANLGGAAFVLDSTVAGNSSGSTSCFFGSTSCAGGIYDADAMTIRRSTISGNESVHGPGGIGASGNSMSIANSTISGNVSDASGGGLEAQGSANVDVLFTTITDNEAANAGGILAGPSGFVTATAAIVAGNTAPSNPDVQGAFTSGGDNLIGIVGAATGFGGGDQVGTAGSPINPKLGPLALNGATTESHALLVESFSQSPAIDAADCIGVIQDQRAEPRPVGPSCDVGAYEFKAPCADGLDNDSDGLVDYPTDPGCQTALAISTENPACDDHVDNDGDDLVDHPADPGCSSAFSSSENPPPPGPCGYGAEYALVLPAVALLRRRRGRNTRGRNTMAP
jgi:CSLREA domain-containing protein